MQSGRALESIPQMTVFDVRAALEAKEDLVVLDVRRKGERTDGYIEGSIHQPLDTLGQHLDDYRLDSPTAVHCKGGYRSAIAASLLQAHGFKHVANVTGGMDAWNAAQLPLVR